MYIYMYMYARLYMYCTVMYVCTIDGTGSQGWVWAGTLRAVDSTKLLHLLKVAVVLAFQLRANLH